MIGRVLGVLIGAAIAATGYGIWRPAAFARFVDLSHVGLGDFGQHRTVVSFLIMAVGAAVALAALQRPPERKRAPKAAVMFTEPEATAVFAPAPAEALAEPDSHAMASEPAPVH